MRLAESYATALFQIRQEAKAPQAVLSSFLEGLKRRGHLKLLPRILAEYEKLEVRRSRRRPKIAMAREEDRKEAVEKAREFLPDGTEVEVCIDPTLVSDYVISGPDFRYDASGRRSLLSLYKRLIAAK